MTAPPTLLQGKRASKYLPPLSQKTMTRNERKRQFNQLLMYEVQAMRAASLRPVLMGDFNISRSELDAHPRLRTQREHVLSRKHFNEEVMGGMDVVDVYRAREGIRGKDYSWFAYGKRAGEDCYRVDFALVDRGIYRAEEGVRVGRMSYLSQVDDRKGDPYSDHAPMLLELHL